MSAPDHAKCDHELGMRVHQHLLSKGLETPMKEKLDHIGLFDHEMVERIAPRFKEIMEILSLDLSDDSLADTPTRWAKMMVEEMCSGLDYARFPKCTAVKNKMMLGSAGGFVLEDDIRVSSMCEHHFVTIDGLANVAYIPEEKVLGLSKLNRIVDFFSRRPQIQERLTAQIAEAISFVADTPHVIVQINAVHHCVKSRGIRDANSSTSTLVGLGAFTTNGPTRTEFLSRLK